MSVETAQPRRIGTLFSLIAMALLTAGGSGCQGTQIASHRLQSLGPHWGHPSAPDAPAPSDASTEQAPKPWQ